MKVLVISPHMDDEVLGCGGTIARHVKEGDDVAVCIVAHRIYDHEFSEKANQKEQACAEAAQKELGYKEIHFLNLPDEKLDGFVQEILIPLEAVIQEFQPERVYVNHGGDNHQDHKAVFHAAMIALRPAANPKIQKVLTYEVPSSTDQSPPLAEYAFLPNTYVDIEKHLPTKLKAMSCYEREMRSFPHPRSLEALEIHAKKRGVEIGFRVAEAFCVIRDKR